MKLIIEYPGHDYDLIVYPAGEMQVRLKPEIIPRVHEAQKVEIRARVVTSSALIGLVLLTNALRGSVPGVEMILRIPYLPYARADRRFVDGDCYGLEAFGDILRTCRFAHIETLDVHNARKAFSHVSSFLWNVRPDALILAALADLSLICSNHSNGLTILFPDEGARTRYGNMFGQSGYLNQVRYEVAHASKVRDPATGALSGFSIPEIKHTWRGVGTMPVLIVDDICDGGGTFNGIAAAIDQKYCPDNNIDLGLCVTHGIFSQGFDALRQNFRRIYTTNSFQDWSNEAEWLVCRDAWEIMDGSSK